MRDLVVFSIVFAFLPIALVRTNVGIMLWNWIGFMNPHRLGWGFAYHFQFAAIIGAVTLVSFVFSKDRKMIPFCPLVFALLGFIFWMNITTLYALVPEDAVNQWNKVMKIQLFIFISISVMQSRQRILQFLTVITLSVAYFGFKGGFFTLLSGGNFRVLGPPGSQIEDNNTLALALIMVVPLVLYLAKYTKIKWVRYGLFAGSLFCGFSILGSHSRGAFLAGSCMVFFLFLKSNKKMLMATIMLMFLPILITFMPSHWFERMNTIKTYEEDASAMGRINAWHFAFNLAKHRPMVGGGFETFRPGLFERFAPIPDDYHDAHSIYFEVMGEQGFMGLFWFLLVILLSWRTARWIIIRSNDRQDLSWAKDLARMIQVSLIGYVVGGAFLGVAYFDLFYSLVAILVLLQNEVKKSCPEPVRGCAQVLASTQ